MIEGCHLIRRPARDGRHRFHFATTAHTVSAGERLICGLGFWGAGGCSVGGAILAHYNQLGGAAGLLGPCVTSELTTPDGVGRYNHFQNGSIYWTSATGAWEVHGEIRNAWSAEGWENSALGYPTTDELATGEQPTTCGGGRVSHFQGGAIYWTAALGPHEVIGAAQTLYGSMQAECSALGFPTAAPVAINGGQQTAFQHGTIFVDAAGVAIAQVN